MRNANNVKTHGQLYLNVFEEKHNIVTVYKE